MLQCVAACIFVNAAISASTSIPLICSVLQCVAVCCSVLQCVAVCCSVLQCVAMCYSALQYVHKRLYIHTPHLQCIAVYCSMLRRVAACCVAGCCTVLQCVAVCCRVLQCITVCCSMLPCVAVCCRVLQRHILLIYTQTCVGCQKVLHILLQTITFIFSHPIHLHSQSSQLLLQCRASESPMDSTACHQINILTPYTPSRQHRMCLGRQKVICVQDMCSTACYT